MLLKLITRKTEVPDVETLIFQPTEPVTWQAGQYFHYVLHHEPTDDRGSDRWFTIASAPSENVVRITTRFTEGTGSSFKKALRQLEVGSPIEVSNLEGEFVVSDPNQHYVFIAGGIGITPFRSILKQLDFEKKPINVTLLYANKDQNVVYKEELEDIAQRNPSFKIEYVFSPEHIGEPKIKAVAPDLTAPFFYVSGPEPMVESIGTTLKEMGVPTDHLKQDWFPGYPKE